jgi:hypothetical protein
MMLGACQSQGVAGNAVDVKYEGQRTDKAHAVNGSASVRGQSGRSSVHSTRRVVRS